jgi:thioredoxin reductase (NADPH)
MKILLLIIFFLTANILYAVEDVVILGGGVGGMSSALYLSRAGVKTILIEGNSPGGLIAQSHKVQNWPSELEISGYTLAEKIKEQAISSGTTFLDGVVTSVDFTKKPYVINIKLQNKEEKLLKAKSCIIAMGTTPNLLKIEGEAQFWGKGVTNCAVCDGPLYKNKSVAIVGGGDSAILEADYLSDIAKQIYIFVRKPQFKTVEQKRLLKLKQKKNVKIFYQSTISAIHGNKDSVTHIDVLIKNKAKSITIDGVFLAIGSKPNSIIFQDQLKLDHKGYIILEKDQKTNLDGIYAVGDIVDPVYKQAISASGDGAKAAIQAIEYLAK